MNYISRGITRRPYDSERRAYTITSCAVMHSEGVAPHKRARIYQKMNPAC